MEVVCGCGDIFSEANMDTSKLKVGQTVYVTLGYTAPDECIVVKVTPEGVEVRVTATIFHTVTPNGDVVEIRNEVKGGICGFDNNGVQLGADRCIGPGPEFGPLYLIPNADPDAGYIAWAKVNALEPGQHTIPLTKDGVLRCRCGWSANEDRKIQDRKIQNRKIREHYEEIVRRHGVQLSPITKAN